MTYYEAFNIRFEEHTNFAFDYFRSWSYVKLSNSTINSKTHIEVKNILNSKINNNKYSNKSEMKFKQYINKNNKYSKNNYRK